jgi:colicin import membrane protein
MGRSNESSLLFSLRELETLEHERLAAEKAEQDGQREASRRARQEEELRARDAEGRRLIAEEQRRVDAERARRDEASRLEASHHAVVERARAEVQARARVEVLRLEEAHEVAMEQARARGAYRRHRWVTALGAVALASVGTVAVLLSVELHDLERLDAERAAVAAREREGCERVERALGGTRQNLAELDRQLRVLRSAVPAPDLAPRSPTQPSPVGRVPARPASRPVSKSATACTGDGDPLNGCLPRAP